MNSNGRSGIAAVKSIGGLRQLLRTLSQSRARGEPGCADNRKSATIAGINAFMPPFPVVNNDLLEQLPPLLVDHRVEFGTHFRHVRELFLPLPGPGGIKDRPGIKSFFADGDNRIQGPAPGAAQDVDVLYRIDPRAHGPHDVVEAGDVNVVVHHHDVAPEVSPGPALGSHQSRLLRVPRVALLDPYDHQQPCCTLPEEYGKKAFCPVMGDEVTVNPKTQAVKYKGKVYYFCCGGCPKKFKQNPEKYAK